MKHMKVSSSEKKNSSHQVKKKRFPPYMYKKKMMQNLLVYADRWQQMEGKRAPKYICSTSAPNINSSF